MQSHRFSMQAARAVLASRRFFYGIIALLCIETLWIIFTSHYPMAFDEDFHFGLIKIYAQHLNPFLSSQPAGADAFGSVARDPSYLYQYFMSFPYRFIRLFTANQTNQIIFLRLINLMLFACCLPLYKKLLLRTRASLSIIHGCLLLFVLVPIVPLLAAQINYDNLLLPLVPLALLLTLRFNDDLTNKHQINLKTLMQLSIACLLTSLVKYAFLPIFAAIIVYVLIRIKQAFPRLQQHRQLRHPIFVVPKYWLTLVVLLLISFGMFVQRDGINVIRYHTPVPTCDQVLTVQQCSQYGPWDRDYVLANNKTSTNDNPFSYTRQWLYGMWLRSLFTVDGPTTLYQTRGPLLLPALAGIVFPILGAIAFVLTAKSLFKRYNQHVLWLLVACTVSYVCVLWLDDYRAFLHTDEPVAINGRYLLLVMPLLFVAAAVAIQRLVRYHRQLFATISLAAIVCMVWGGGALTYIIRSNDSWYRPNQVVYDLNHAVQKLAPAIPGSNKPTAFLH